MGNKSNHIMHHCWEAQVSKRILRCFNMIAGPIPHSVCNIFEASLLVSSGVKRSKYFASRLRVPWPVFYQRRQELYLLFF